ncbi:fasciclin domain-containing protein [Pacificimonas sp. ICDLI1SI03]|jgi:uncharacterized surface protein with fasciclin (FAS1) repeats|tara:strand:+ start:21371 stop:21958 length:588 start_codon:yes stop_codon:yes gene_type:complete
MKRTAFSVFLCSSAILGLAACDSPQPEPAVEVEEQEAVAAEPAGPTASEVLAGNPDLSTLNGLVEGANMGPFIDGAESFTLFAPTNEAFEKVDSSTLEYLTDPENASSLRQVLGYHLLRNDMKAADLTAAIEGGSDSEATMTTSNSFQITGKMNEEGVPVLVDADGDEAAIVESDVAAGNGTIHIIDTVLMPPQN